MRTKGHKPAIACLGSHLAAYADHVAVVRVVRQLVDAQGLGGRRYLLHLKEACVAGTRISQQPICSNFTMEFCTLGAQGSQTSFKSKK